MARAMQPAGHIHNVLELHRRGVDEAKISGLSAEEAKKLLDELQQQEKDVYDEQEAEDIIKTLDNTDLPHKLKLYRVQDPEWSLKDDDSRKERLKYQLMKKHTDVRSVSELLPRLQETAQGFKESCESLEHIGREVHSFVFGDLVKRAPSFMQSVSRDIPKGEETTLKTLERLACGECPIIVTGEVSTGKSSFLNLLLQGTGIKLPNTEQETTSCICEIRHSRVRRAVVHPRFVPPGEETTITIEDWTTEQLDYHVNIDRHQPGKHPNSKIEIYSPVELLKHGIVLVDTPGIEANNKEMTQFVVDYLQHSVGFIYILNKAIDVHRIQRLFDVEESVAREQLNAEISDELSARMPRKTLFIVNKWDQVQDQERMLTEVKCKLQKTWLQGSSTSQEESAALPKDSLEAHVLPLSVTRDGEHLIAGYVGERLNKLVESLEEIVPNHMEIQLRKHYRWLLFVISRVESHAQKYLSIADHIDDGKCDEILGEATRKLASLRQLGRKQCSEFQRYVQKLDLSEIAVKLAEHLQKSDVLGRITTWNSENCPEAVGSYDAIKAQAKRMVEQRVQTEVENWEHDTRLFQEQREDIEQTVARLMQPIDEGVGLISRQLNPNNPLELDLPGFRFSSLPKPGFFGSVLLLMNRLFTEQSVLDERDKSAYAEHPEKTMQVVAAATMNALRGRNQVRNLAFKALRLNEAHLKFKQHVEHALDTLEREIRELRNHDPAECLRSTYQPIQLTCSKLYTQLQAWEIGNLFQGRQLHSDDVTVGEAPVCLGSGNVAKYHSGTMKAEGHMPVTCKTFTVKDDYPAIFQDYKWLRDHNHDFIAKAIGLIQATDKIELTVVLEGCVQSLGTWLTDKRRWGENGGNLGTILQFATATCQALSFLHSKGRVHGDLMPQTILLANHSTSHHAQSAGTGTASKFVVKLCHSGVKEGTAVVDHPDEPLRCKYFSPELLPRKSSKRRYYPSADVYSFGVILSDMWFGPDDRKFTTTYLHPKDKTNASSRVAGVGFKVRKAKAVSNLKLESFTDIKVVTDDSSEGNRPPREYHDLMRDCSGNLRDIPDIDTVQNQLLAIIQKYQGDGQILSDI